MALECLKDIFLSYSIKNDSGLVKENGILGTNSHFLLKWFVAILGIVILASKKK